MKLKSINYSAREKKHSPREGQFYIHKMRNEVFVVSYDSHDRAGEWALICINDGMTWDGWKSEIENIFDGDDEDFELIPEGTELTFTV